MRPLQGCSCFMHGQMSTDKIRPIWLRQKDRSFWANWAINSRSNRAAAQILIIFVKMVASKAFLRANWKFKPCYLGSLHTCF